jgi:ATP-dependent DNA helicase RecQ
MIDPHIVAVLYDVFKLPSLRPSQLPIITTILANQDIVAVLPTGGGKSLCFQLPAVIFPGLTIVISPLLSLINDQVTKLSLLGVSAATISSQISLRQKLLTLRNIHHQKTKILYISPEQLHSRKLLRALQPKCH